VENYFNYFTEIEEHFQRRRGTLTLLSPLDWALMEIWKDSGIPLEAVLRGIDTSFDKWEKRPKRTRKINGLAFCAQAVLVTAEEMAEATVGKAGPKKADVGLEKEAVCNYLVGNAESLESGSLPESIRALAIETATGLRQAAASLEMRGPSEAEALERRLTVMEEKLLASLLATTPEAVLLELRTEADRDLAPYRSRMSGPQIAQLHRQYVHKKLIEQYRLPRLSLFYMH
jgi:hypothetical protein